MSAASMPNTVNALPGFNDFTGDVLAAHVPSAVDAPQAFATRVPLNVLGAARVPLGVGDWRRLKLGRDIVPHASVPKG
jgi:hypothetical protein